MLRSEFCISLDCMDLSFVLTSLSITTVTRIDIDDCMKVYYNSVAPIGALGVNN